MNETCDGRTLRSFSPRPTSSWQPFLRIRRQLHPYSLPASKPTTAKNSWFSSNTIRMTYTVRVNILYETIINFSISLNPTKISLGTPLENKRTPGPPAPRSLRAERMRKMSDGEEIRRIRSPESSKI
ncbi:hypothetical protein Droror1_Dr00008376 [Drosera rotundifolia]